MFTGSANFAEGVYDHSISRFGGAHNAYTTKDYTLYYATVAREHLADVMAMEADRFGHLNFDPEKATRELKVITEERNMRVENNAFAQLSEQLTALTFLNHPYHHPTIGWAEDMATFTLADAKEFFATYYRPSNMMLIVAGDVTPSEVRREAQRYFGALPGGPAAPRIWPDEPPFRLERHATMHDVKAREPRLLRHYVAPSVSHGASGQAMPLSLLAHYLGGSDSSVLYQNLVVEQHLASSVEVEYDPFSLGPTLVEIVATPAPGVSLEQLEQGLDKALADVLAKPLDDAAFARAKTHLKAEVIFAQDGLEPLTQVMATLFAAGRDEQYFYDWPKAVEAVSISDMQAAAKTVLAPNKRVTGYLLPEVAAPTPVTPEAAASTTTPADASSPAATVPAASAPSPVPATEAPHAP